VSSHVAHRHDDSAPPRLCQNCGTALSGPYCSQCGQHDIEYHRSFYHLAEDVVENLFHFDGKFLVSVAWMLAKPGRLTTEFNAGRRASQVPPLRFYIFVTVLFFLGLQLLHHGHIFDYDRHAVDEASENTKKGVQTAFKQLSRKLTPEQRAELRARLSQAATKKEDPLDPAEISAIVTQFEAELDARQPPVATSAASPAAPSEAPAVAISSPPAKKPGQPKVTIDRNSDLGKRLEEKVNSGELSLSGLLDELEHRVPTLLAIGMPIFALLLKLVYFRRRRYYIEHLVFSLHLHTWAFLAAMVGGGWWKLLALISPVLGTIFGWAFALWIPWYVVAAFRHVYGQSWGKTSVKVALAGMIYAVALVAMTVLIIFCTVAWLAWE
jgi:uncharacterized protein DUF3667